MNDMSSFSDEEHWFDRDEEEMTISEEMRESLKEIKETMISFKLIGKTKTFRICYDCKKDIAIGSSAARSFILLNRKHTIIYRCSSCVKKLKLTIQKIVEEINHDEALSYAYDHDHD